MCIMNVFTNQTKNTFVFRNVIVANTQIIMKKIPKIRDEPNAPFNKRFIHGIPILKS